MADCCNNCGQSRASIPGGELRIEPVTKMMLCRGCYTAFVMGYTMGKRDWLTRDAEYMDGFKQSRSD